MDLMQPNYKQEANKRLAKPLLRHCDQLFTFLFQEGIDATNWRAEPAIRPAVVNRKVWGGNRTCNGAAAQCIIVSELVTCSQRGMSSLRYLMSNLASPDPLPVFAGTTR